MKKLLLICLAIPFATVAFGQKKYWVIKDIMVYPKPQIGAFHLYVSAGSDLELGTLTEGFFQVTYKGKVRYMPQEYLQENLSPDSTKFYSKPRPDKQFPIDNLTGKITYTDVVKVDSTLLKDEVYMLAREWFAKAFRSSKEVIQLEDKAAGKIVGKAIFEGYIKYKLGGTETGGNVSYTISVAVKDGRYKYEITDFIHRGLAYGDLTVVESGPMERFLDGKHWSSDQWLNQIDQEAHQIIQSLKVAMAMPSILKDKDDW